MDDWPAYILGISVALSIAVACTGGLIYVLQVMTSKRMPLLCVMILASIFGFWGAVAGYAYILDSHLVEYSELAVRSFLPAGVALSIGLMCLVRRRNGQSGD